MRRRIAWVTVTMLFLIGTQCRAQRISGTWQQQQLGTVLERLTKASSLELWLDRRVDPSQPVNASFNDVLATEAIESLAERHRLGVLRIGKLVYVGPPKTARGLAALLLRARQAAAKSAPSLSKKWQEEHPIRWPRLTQPRQLLEKLLGTNGIEISDLELVPLDLWPERTLAPMSLADQVVLILAGFDLTCELANDGRNCRIVPIKFPLPDHTDRLAVSEPPQQRASSNRATKNLFSLELKNQPVGGVVQQLAAQLKLEVVWDEASLAKHNRSKETLVSCEVSQVEVDRLLAAILKPAGMTFTRDSKSISIQGVP